MTGETATERFAPLVTSPRAEDLFQYRQHIRQIHTMANSKLVALVGRPNVGKSTLFNRLTESRTAIVSDTPGTTRDRQYGRCEWQGRSFSIVDTGGWVGQSDETFESAINKQVEMGLAEADLIVFLVDVKEGLTPLDMEIANMLRRTDKPLMVVANKADNFTMDAYAAEFYALSLGDPYPISATNGAGTGDFLDALVALLPEESVEEEKVPDMLRLAIVGRPNAGKSTLVNTLLDEDRHIVTDISGTTRDSIYTHYDRFGHNLLLVDTAGVREKRKVSEDIEYYSVLRSITAIENSDVCVLMLDATQGIEAVDVNVYSIVRKNNKGLIVCINKWDLIEEKGKEVMETYKAAIRSRLAPFTDFPILFISALTRQRVLKILDLAEEIYAKRKTRISTGQLNKVLLPIIGTTPPPMIKGKMIKIKYITMLPGVTVPSFVFFCNLPQWIKEPYKRFLENKIRANWDFSGTPINLFFREK